MFKGQGKLTNAMRLPKVSKRTKYITLATLVVILWRVSAVAQSTGNTFTMQEPSTLLDIYKQAAAGWTNQLFRYANSLFTFLLLIEFTYSAITHYLQHQELQGWMAAMLRKVLSLGAFYVLLVQGPTWIPAIIDSLQVIGQNVGAGALAPDTIVGHGFNITMNLFAAANDKGFIMNTGIALLLSFAALVVLFSYVFIAIQFIIAKIESYILVSAGTIFLGFGGSRWTSSYTERYIGGAVASGIKLMMLYLIIALGDPLAQGWVNEANSMIGMDDSQAFATAFSIATGVLIYMVICWTTPKLVSALISGSPSLSGSDLTQAAVFGVSAGVGAAAVGAGGAGLLAGESGAAAGGATGGGGGVQSTSQAAGSGSTFMSGGAPPPMAAPPVAPPAFFPSNGGNGGGEGASFGTSTASDIEPPSSEQTSPNGHANGQPGSRSATPGASGPSTSAASGAARGNGAGSSNGAPAAVAPPPMEGIVAESAASSSTSSDGNAAIAPVPPPDSSTPGSTQSAAGTTPTVDPVTSDASGASPAPSNAPVASGSSASAAAPSSGDSSTADDKQPGKSKLQQAKEFLDNTRHHINQSNLPHDGGGGGTPPNLKIEHHE